MNANYKKAFVEVEQIINQLDEDHYQKIPKSFIQLIQKQKDKKYKSRISFKKPLIEQKLLPETKAVLAVIHRLYLCS